MESRSIVLDVTFRAALADRWEHLEIRCDACDVTVRYGVQALRTRTRHRVVSDLVAHLRCRICGAAPTSVHLVRTHEDVDPFKFLPFRVEEWTHDGRQVETMKAACGSVTAGWAAYHVVVADNPGRHVTLRIGSYLLASTRPEPPPEPPSNVTQLPARKHGTIRPARRRARIAPF
ncbi:hypothetical protein [Pleomorphomonas koreensis]|uniref:hypothetical protein n=1 Tax=Pleomorphomonas koreensis TaxID=257440 RepID=UPI0003FABD7B|nr:hypothetical protein [Pleomorphomonas koreensis]